jgi:type I restriction enzyme M protein
VALPTQLFYSTGIPVCLWILNRDKSGGALGETRDRRGRVLFIDARELGSMVSRVHRELLDNDIEKITTSFREWRGEPGYGDYADEAGFCASISLNQIAAERYILAPGRFVGARDNQIDEESPDHRLRRLTLELRQLFVDAAEQEAAVIAALDKVHGDE